MRRGTKQAIFRHVERQTWAVLPDGDVALGMNRPQRDCGDPGVQTQPGQSIRRQTATAGATAKANFFFWTRCRVAAKAKLASRSTGPGFTLERAAPWGSPIAAQRDWPGHPKLPRNRMRSPFALSRFVATPLRCLAE